MKSSARILLGLIFVALAGKLTSLLLGATKPQWIEQSREQMTVLLGGETSKMADPQTPKSLPPSEVFSLVSLPTPERISKLELILERGHQPDQNRARYLLAVTALENQQPDQALQYLDNLDMDYPLLTGYIRLKQADAYVMKGESENAAVIWSEIIENDFNSAIIGEARYHLGKKDPQNWETLIAEYPEHPRTHEIIQERLAKNPDQPALLKILSQQTPEAKGMNQVRDRLVSEYQNQLTPEDWSAIAQGYWETWEYGKAGEAYGNAPKTPKNLYRQARSLQVSGETGKAKQIYLELLKTFPDTEETGLGLRRLAGMVSRSEAIFYLDQVINQFPQEAPDALITQAQLLAAEGKTQLAQQARETLLNNYSQSDAAADYRWERAEAAAKQGNIKAAIDWVTAITEENPKDILAAKAGFWRGKWLQQQGETTAAETQFQETLSQYPESYYAWRSAVHLGLPVGDFDTIRDQMPKVVKPTSRPSLPAGSALLKELYRLGQDDAAWTLWQMETSNSSSLSVEEQFTDGVLRLTQAKYLQGIGQISSLQYRDEPAEIARWQNLRETPMYWQALFPFPYHKSILKWSQQRELNPLLTISLIRQESRFEKEIGSVAGAKGLMQIMPSTGEWVASKTNLKTYSLVNPEDNIQLGTWYLDYTHDRYDNHSMLAVASYNAGPGNVAKWVKRYGLADADEFVQNIPFPETKGYVEAVFGNYWNYLRLYNPEIQTHL
ncbi:Lytic transglycosylase catalytic [Halothece sp. PCC 7418]|uniref:transglycosylase SLT domain-containing protein n=1 Tax=Halothece sp. (strain PCC 7418) TaxID=65093 RepID=UPI0002A06BED|nr:transglycosylase SLT domain-containing protein [Halothece sp. PCC 7418]AFZ45477.1 Lytic transglycosylase catalytic [Halothece sp. PCC 7418]